MQSELIIITKQVICGDVLASGTPNIWMWILLLQDWQEIVSLYEADNVYLGKNSVKLKLFNIF